MKKLLALLASAGVLLSQPMLPVTEWSLGWMTLEDSASALAYLGSEGFVTSEDLSALATTVSEIPNVTSVGNLSVAGTNTVESGFENLVLVKPATYASETIETLTPDIDFDLEPRKRVVITGNTSWTYSNYKDGQVVYLVLTNASGAEALQNWGDLNFRTSVIPESLPTDGELWMAIECVDSALWASYETTQEAALSVGFGGTGRSSHPQNYLLVGDGGNATRAAQVGTGLNISGTGQAQLLSLTNSVATPALLEITTVTAGAPVWTNTANVLATNTSVFLSADVLFSGSTNTVAFKTLANVRFDDEITVSTNELIAPAGASLWAGWTTNASYYPVLQVGGLDGEPGVLQIANIQQWSISLTAALAPAADDWAGHILTENFEAPGFENSLIGSTGGFDADNTEQKYNGSYAMKLTGAANVTWGMPAAKSAIAGRFNLRIADTPSIGGRAILRIGDSISARGNAIGYIYLSTARKLYAVHGSTSATATADPVPTDTWVSVYYYYAKGTGANGVFKIGFSTTDNKTADNDEISETTAGTSTADVGNVEFLRASTGEVDRWVDAIVVHDDMTWNDLPDGLPDDI